MGPGLSAAEIAAKWRCGPRPMREKFTRFLVCSDYVPSTATARKPKELPVGDARLVRAQDFPLDRQFFFGEYHV